MLEENAPPKRMATTDKTARPTLVRIAADRLRALPPWVRPLSREPLPHTPRNTGRTMFVRSEDGERGAPHGSRAQRVCFADRAVKPVAQVLRSLA